MKQVTNLPLLNNDTEHFIQKNEINNEVQVPDILPVLEKYNIHLKRSGKEMVSLCPFHEENTPSFFVNPQKNVYNCFGCGESGNTFSFVMKKENTDFAGALKILGLENRTQHISLSEYFNNRGIFDTTLRAFKISEHNGVITFPYIKKGETVNRKYRPINNKTYWCETGKQKPWYNVDTIASSDTIIICEGEIDALSIYQAGFPNVISVFNGINSKLDADTLRDKQIVLAVDNDEAGLKLLEKLIQAFSAERCTIVTWPSGCKDANEVLVKHGKQALIDCLANPVPVKKAAIVEDEPIWTDPFPVEIELPDVLPFTKDMLPLSLQPWIFDIAERMNTPVDFIAVSAMIAAGSIIGSRCGVKPKQLDNWTEVPNFWGAIIAGPSRLKTPSIAEVFKLFVPLELEARTRRAAADLNYKIESELKEIETKEALKKLKKTDADKDSIKEEIKALGEEVKRPTEKRYRAGDVSVEKLADLCVENPDGILVFRDELVGLLKSWEKLGNEHARAFYLEAWNGKNPYQIDRVARGSFFIENLCISLFGAIQPDKLQSYLFDMVTGSNDGMVQRLQLMVYPDVISYKYTDRIPDREARNYAYKIYKDLSEVPDFVELGAERSEFDKMPAFRFDPEAQVLFVDWLNDLQVRLDSGDLSPYLIEHLGKYRSLMPCLALTFHLINCVQNPAMYHGEIKLESAVMAVKWIEYLTSHAMRVYNGLGQVKKHSAIELSKKIQNEKLPPVFSVRMIQQQNWHLLNDGDVIKSAIAELIELGWIREKKAEKKGTGRPGAPEYIVNPIVRGGVM